MRAALARRARIDPDRLAFSGGDSPITYGELRGCRLEIGPATFEGLSADAARLAPLDPSASEPDSVAYLQLTSGTSGDQRAAVILQRNLEATLRGMHEMIGFGPSDVMAGSIPLHYNFGLVRFVCAPVYSGCACYLTGAPPANVGRWLALMSEVRATVTAGPDYLYRAAALRVDPRDVDLRSLRFASNGGEAVHLDTIRLFEDRFRVPGTVRRSSSASAVLPPLAGSARVIARPRLAAAPPA